MRYEIKKGDTLSGIAKKFGTSWNELARDNKIMNPDKIKSGSSIIVPQAQKPTMETQVEIAKQKPPIDKIIVFRLRKRTSMNAKKQSAPKE